ncbi:MAG TPA: phosphatase PAP2 family protein [bacterium]|nr:phosphatase PAP2 family protein [bacterium]
MTYQPRPLRVWHWLVPAGLLLAATVLVWAGDGDRRVARLVYVPGGVPAWPLGYREPWNALYEWGVFPALLVAVLGVLLLTRGRLAPRRALERWAGALIVLGMVLGPFLLVNGVLHNAWGRPRPRQVLEFGGTQPFRPVLLPTGNARDQSFPTGHAVGGFSLLGAYFVLRERWPRWAWAALGLGLAAGGVVAWARITQGGHWLSDGLWCAGVVYFSFWAAAQGLAWRARRARDSTPAPPGPLRRALIVTVGSAASAALIIGYLAYLPLQQALLARHAVPQGPGPLHLQLVAPPLHVSVLPGKGTELVLWTTLSGRGAPWTQLTGDWEPAPAQQGTAPLRYVLHVRGLRRAMNLDTEVHVPQGTDVRLEVSQPAP